MGVDMELEFNKYCVVDRSPKTVLLSPRHSKAEKRKVKGKPRCGNEELSQSKDFTEINFHRYRSASCRTVPSRLEGNVVQRRGSVYQSSNEVRKSTKKIGATEERKKIEFSRSSATTFSLEIVDSLCSSDEDSLKPSMLDLPCSPIKESVLLSDSVDMSLDFGNRTKLATEDEATEAYKFRCDKSVALPKSLSARLAVPQSPCQLESDSSRPTSPKSRFSPIRKMFDPFVKSKSQKSPLGSAVKTNGATPPVLSMSRNKTLRKSLLHDLSSSVSDKEHEISQYVKKDSSLPVAPQVPCSPAHLSGLLKLENKHGVPSFEFSVKNPEDVIVAKTWKVGNALNWVYTFHSTLNKRKSSVTGRGSKEGHKESTMVGQMQVSCYLCTELKDAGAFNNSMVTEFVLYDVAHQQRSDVKLPTGSNENPVVEACDLNELPDQGKHKLQPKLDNDLPIPYPRALADLHSDLEIAAIVVQLPFEKRESLKCKRGDWRSDDELLNFSGLELENKCTSDCSSPAKVNVVTPLGNHGLPTAENESRGASPLLDRWRLGGGCDCGGWDMGCPLVVFGNPNIQYDEDHPLLENQPLQLFVQGTKDNKPGLSLRAMEEGQYSVDFHAQLTSLQAFSICVAILHSSKASIAIDQDRDRQLLQCDSLRVFVEDEVMYKIHEEGNNKRLGKKKVETVPSFVLNPPFSPIARV